MDKALDAEVRRRAGDRCEYCHLPQWASTLKHVVDHIVARQHRGKTISENLALACGRCISIKDRTSRAATRGLETSLLCLIHELAIGPRIFAGAEHYLRA